MSDLARKWLDARPSGGLSWSEKHSPAEGWVVIPIVATRLTAADLERILPNPFKDRS